MAKPNKEAPVLTGKDAEAFVDRMKEAVNTRVDSKEWTRIRENFARLQAIAKF